jgi:hypothetical protein
VVRTDPACDTVVHLCLSSTPPGLKPDTVLLMELTNAVDDQPMLYALTLPQAAQLQDEVARLLAAST